MKRFTPYRSSAKRPFRRKPKILAFKPRADAALKKIFAAIGPPPPSAFNPDPFQLEAVEAAGQSDCLVTAPTGSGKTWIALQAIERMLGAGKCSWYASPLKALSNSKYQEFCEHFGSTHVGILTGDRKENADAPLIVGTTEILRNQLYDAMHRGEMLVTDFVVLDEAHFLGDEDRGVVWEEIMIYLPPRIPLLMLSATIGNAEQIADWLSAIRSQKCLVIQEKHRPVPLYHLFMHPSGTLLPLLDNHPPKNKKHISKKVRAYIDSKHPPLLAPPRRLPPLGEILQILKKYHLLPAIFFLKSRADCDYALELCTENIISDADHKQRLSSKIQQLAAESEYILHHQQLWHLEHLAVGAHHSGQLPSWKLTLEKMMTQGLLDAIFATSTVAAGVNFPARSIVFLNSDRFNGREFLPLTATEFHQMTGRAGRRGMDQIGFALTIPGKFMNVRLVAQLITSQPSPVLSQIRINFSMALNLLLSHKPDQIKDLLERSFATYLISHKQKKSTGQRHVFPDRKALWADFVRHLQFLKATGFVNEKDRLTKDGQWASQLRVDQPLMIAEGFRQKLLPVSDPALLAALISLFVNEDESEIKDTKGSVPQNLSAAHKKLTKNLAPFAGQMISQGFAVRPLVLRPAVVIFMWATGHSWETILSAGGFTEGHLAMLILRTADNLRHVRALKRVFPEAAASAAVALEMILRDPVITTY